MSMASMSSISWSDLQEDLLELIFQQFTNIFDLYRCYNVCRSWRPIAKNLLALSPPQLPVLKYQDPDIDRIQMFNPFNDSSSMCRFPKFKTHDGCEYEPKSVSSGHGWLLINYTTSKCIYGESHAHYIYLYNPLTRVGFWLPTLLLDHNNRRMEATRLVLLSKPTSPSCVVLSLSNYSFDEKKFAFWRTGYKVWRLFPHSANVIGDSICYKGEIYAIKMRIKEQSLMKFEISPFHHGKSIPTKMNRSWNYSDNYLVESLCGNLWMVCRVLNPTSSFEVYKLDWEKMEWGEIKSLGDQAIFLACHDSVCIQAGASTMYKQNCIYFTKDVYGGNKFVYNRNEFGIYELGSQTINRVHLSFPKQDRSIHQWFKLDI